MSYLVAVGGVQAAPAVRVGYNWASNNLRLIQTYTTMSCLLFVCVNLILGQAQLVVRSVRAARLWPTRRYPATNIFNSHNPSILYIFNYIHGSAKYAYVATILTC